MARVKGRKVTGKKATLGYETIMELEQLKKINGATRTVSVVVLDQSRPNWSGDMTSASYYGEILDRKPKYHWSSGTGTAMEQIDGNYSINKSISKIGKKRRSSSELDRISIHMGRIVINDIMNFLASGAHNVYQPWKGTSSENLYETGTLRDSIVCVVKNNDKEIWRGR